MKKQMLDRSKLLEAVQDAIRDVLTEEDVEHVVYCKDCIYRMENDHVCTKKNLLWPTSYDYCSRGMRKN